MDNKAIKSYWLIFKLKHNTHIQNPKIETKNLLL